MGYMYVLHRAKEVQNKSVQTNKIIHLNLHFHTEQEVEENIG